MTKTMKLHIKGGRLIDPANGIDKRSDLFIADGLIVGAGDTPPKGFEACSTLDATGLNEKAAINRLV